jgi:hypothetical protein
MGEEEVLERGDFVEEGELGLVEGGKEGETGDVGGLGYRGKEKESEEG